jgi:hypothetical protein
MKNVSLQPSILDLIRKLEELKARVAQLETDVAAPSQKWIPVKERLPDKDGFYLVSCIWGIDVLAFRGTKPGISIGTWWDDEERMPFGIIHWMPLPPDPREEVQP